MKKPLLAGAVAIVLALAWTPGGPAGVDAQLTGGGADTREVSEKLRDPAKPGSLFVGGTAAAVAARELQGVAGEAAIGDQASWIALNDAGGFFYDKIFELRAVNDLGEVWLSVGEGLDPAGDPDGILGLNFPDGDCRNDGVRNVVTDAQAAYLLEQFTTSIKPTDEAWFGEPLLRTGTTGDLARPSPAGKQVVLVDNFRDDNFYDTNNASNLPFIAGFFSSAMDFFHNQPQCHVHRRVRLDSQDDRRSPARAVNGPVYQRAGAALPVRGGLCSRVRAPDPLRL
jgi:hypothetical protein